MSLGVLGALLLFYLLTTASSSLAHLKAGAIGIFLATFLGVFYRHRRAVGMGDVKLFCLGCFFTTPQTVPFFMLGSGLLGVGWAFLYKIIFYKKTFPLGPALMISLLGTLLYQVFLS